MLFDVTVGLTMAIECRSHVNISESIEVCSSLLIKETNMILSECILIYGQITIKPGLDRHQDCPDIHPTIRWVEFLAELLTSFPLEMSLSVIKIFFHFV